MIGVIEKLKGLLKQKASDADKRRETEANIPSVHTPYGKKLSISDAEKSKLTDRLTPRERDAYRLLLKGYTLKETARQLEIGYAAAKIYQKAIFRKLHVNSRAELIMNYHTVRKSSGEDNITI